MNGAKHNYGLFEMLFIIWLKQDLNPTYKDRWFKGFLHGSIMTEGYAKITNTA